MTPGWKPKTAADIRVKPRQWETLQLLAEGKTQTEVGMILGIPVSTVRCDVKMLHKKLEISNHTALVRWWVDNVEGRGECRKCPLYIEFRTVR